jgi:RNA polymerase sigma factor (sigma-70 family)
VKKLLKDRSSWLEVWSRFRSGDHAAFGEIYEEFIYSMFAYGSRITRDRELVKDCVQDVFLDIQRLKPDLLHPESLEFYLFKSLKNAILHKIQKNKKIKCLLVTEMAIFDLKFNIEQDTFEPESDRLRIEKLKQILQTLDPQKRELLFLKFSTCLNYVEIGQMLGINPGPFTWQIWKSIDGIADDLGESEQADVRCFY